MTRVAHVGRRPDPGPRRDARALSRRAARRPRPTRDEIVVVDSASRDPAAVAAVARRARRAAGPVRPAPARASPATSAGGRRATTWSPSSTTTSGCMPGWAAALVAGFRRRAVEFVTGGVVVPDDQAGAERPVAITSAAPSASALHPGLSTVTSAPARTSPYAGRRSTRSAGSTRRSAPASWAASAEDLDLFDRLFRADYLGLFEPRAVAEHDQWRTRPQLIALDWRYGKGMGVRLARLARLGPAPGTPIAPRGGDRTGSALGGA